MTAEKGLVLFVPGGVCGVVEINYRDTRRCRFSPLSPREAEKARQSPRTVRFRTQPGSENNRRGPRSMDHGPHNQLSLRGTQLGDSGLGLVHTLGVGFGDGDILV
jgi:hypothetical protein